MIRIPGQMDISDVTWEYAVDRTGDMLGQIGREPDRAGVHEFLIDLLAVLVELGVVRDAPH